MHTNEMGFTVSFTISPSIFYSKMMCYSPSPLSPQVKATGVLQRNTNDLKNIYK